MVRKRIEELITRRERLASALRSLNSELADMDLEIKRERATAELTFGLAFFWGHIVPILLKATDEGLTGIQIRERLSREGYVIDAEKFRVLLTRSKEKGLLEKGRQSPARWRLTEQAKSTVRRMSPGGWAGGDS